MHNAKDMRSPLGRAKGLGSAKDGVAHFWAQRISALALVPLLMWLVFSIIGLVGADYLQVTGWISSPFNAVILVLTLFALFWHAILGIQVVIEDYISDHGLRLMLLFGVKGALLLLGAFSIFSVLKIAL